MCSLKIREQCRYLDRSIRIKDRMFKRIVNTSFTSTQRRVDAAGVLCLCGERYPYRICLSASILLSTRIVLDIASRCTGSAPLFPLSSLRIYCRWRRILNKIIHNGGNLGTFKSAIIRKGHLIDGYVWNFRKRRICRIASSNLQLQLEAWLSN